MKFIPISQPSITKKEIQYVVSAVKSKWVSSIGEYIERFETEFAHYCGVKYALATSNGTTALHLALVSIGVGPGDEVIIPDFTFVATANAVNYTGAKIVFADIDPETLCIDPKDVRRRMNRHTKAIIPVHIYGHPADMRELSKIALKHDLWVIEDAAEAHGAEVRGKKVGSLGDIGVFSFYGNKVITSGEGGMLTTNSKRLYERARLLRDHAMSPKKRYWHTEVGYNYRMTNLQAALGLAQLHRIDELLAKKKKIFEWYRQYLGKLPGIKLNTTCQWAKNVYWMIRLEISGMSFSKRESFMRALKERGVDSRPYFYPISDLPMYNKATTPATHVVCPTGINLPSYFDLTESDVKKVSKFISQMAVGR